MLPADLKRLELLELRFSIVHNLNRTAERLEAINWANSKEPADRGSLEDPPPPSFAEIFEGQTIERLKTELYKMPLEFMFTHEWKHLAWHAVDSFIDAAEVPDAEARSLLPHFLRKGVSEPIYIIPTPLIDPAGSFEAANEAMEWYKSNLPSDLKEFHIGHHVMVRQHSYRESFEDSMARHFALDSLDEFKEVYTGKSFRQIFEEEQVKYAAALNEGASDATS